MHQSWHVSAFCLLAWTQHVPVVQQQGHFESSFSMMHKSAADQSVYGNLLARVCHDGNAALPGQAEESVEQSPSP